jgi:hypothetical protein
MSDPGCRVRALCSRESDQAPKAERPARQPLDFTVQFPTPGVVLRNDDDDQPSRHSNISVPPTSSV